MGTLSSIASTWESQDECDEQMLERLQLLRDAAQGLEALHTNHVVHGDVVSRVSQLLLCFLSTCTPDAEPCITSPANSELSGQLPAATCCNHCTVSCTGCHPVCMGT
jgi:hypothetical protein